MPTKSAGTAAGALAGITPAIANTATASRRRHIPRGFPSAQHSPPGVVSKRGASLTVHHGYGRESLRETLAAGFEPAASASGGQRSINWATGARPGECSPLKVIAVISD